MSNEKFIITSRNSEITNFSKLFKIKKPPPNNFGNIFKTQVCKAIVSIYYQLISVYVKIKINY